MRIGVAARVHTTFVPMVIGYLIASVVSSPKIGGWGMWMDAAEMDDALGLQLEVMIRRRKISIVGADGKGATETFGRG